MSGTIVFACYNDDIQNCFTSNSTNDGLADGFSNLTVVQQTGPSGSFSVDSLQAVQFSVYAFRDADENGSILDPGDYFGAAVDNAGIALVTPPQTSLSIQLVLNSDLETQSTRFPTKALQAVESWLNR